MELKRATADDWEILLKWRNDPNTRLNSHNTELVDKETHVQWFHAMLNNPNTQLYIAFEDKSGVGTVRADFDSDAGAFELSWTIAPDFRGKGIGKIMVKLLADKLDTKLRAEVKPGNISSIKIAEYAGLSFKGEVNGVLHYMNY